MIVIAITCCCYIKLNSRSQTSGASQLPVEKTKDNLDAAKEGKEEVDGPEEGKEEVDRTEDVPWQADYCWAKDCPWQGLVWREKEKKKKMKNHEQKEMENVSEREGERDRRGQPQHVENQYVDIFPLRTPHEAIEGNDVIDGQRDGECTKNQVMCNGQQIAIDFGKDRVGYRQSYYAAANEPQYH